MSLSTTAVTEMLSYIKKASLCNLIPMSAVKDKFLSAKLQPLFQSKSCTFRKYPSTHINWKLNLKLMTSLQKRVPQFLHMQSFIYFLFFC